MGLDGLQVAYLGLSCMQMLKSLLLQVGIDDSLIEAGPLTTEDWVLGANGRLSQLFGHRVGEFHVWKQNSHVQHHYLADIYQFNLISYSEFHTLRCMTQSTCLLDNCISLGRASGAQQMYQSDGFLSFGSSGLGDMWKPWIRSGQKGAVFQENIIEMNNGCICCTVRGDLIAGLKKMATAPVKHSRNDIGQGCLKNSPRTPEAGNMRQWNIWFPISRY